MWSHRQKAVSSLQQWWSGRGPRTIILLIYRYHFLRTPLLKIFNITILPVQRVPARRRPYGWPDIKQHRASLLLLMMRTRRRLSFGWIFSRRHCQQDHLYHRLLLLLLFGELPFSGGDCHLFLASIGAVCVVVAVFARIYILAKLVFVVVVVVLSSDVKAHYGISER